MFKRTKGSEENGESLHRVVDRIVLSLLHVQTCTLLWTLAQVHHLHIHRLGGPTKKSAQLLQSWRHCLVTGAEGELVILFLILDDHFGRVDVVRRPGCWYVADEYLTTAESSEVGI